jgi:Asp-tRNA(Asn)/Glu-tRNA(Gln) amidotransferase A subunit family amidase
LETARQHWWKFFGIAGGMLLGPMLDGREADISPMLKEFNGWVAQEPRHTGDTLLATWMGRDEVRAGVLADMQRFPILLCPVAAIPAFRHREREWLVEGKTVKYLDAWSYTEWFNLLGFPAAVVPMGKSLEGLPIGVQVVGRPWEEELVLAIAGTLEEQRGRFYLPVL